MLVFEWTILLLAAAVFLAGVARRIGVPWPAFLALGGAAVAFVPHAPQLALEPELALALFVAPVLLDAAYDTSVRDLKQNWRPVGALVVGAVVVTTLLVAMVAKLLVRDMPWGVAIALGAIVAPPDAAAATAVLRQVKLPHRLMVILEGESLLNDATALLIYRAAVGAVVAGSFNAWHAAPRMVLAVAGSVVLGVVAACVYRRVIRRVRETTSSIVMQFVGTFGVWLAAERLHLSGILTVVTYGVTVARWAPTETPARLRVPSYAVWETVTFVMNVLAFLLIGLQLGPIWGRLSGRQHASYTGIAAAVLVTTVAARFAWVTAYRVAVGWLMRRWPASGMEAPPARSSVAVSWCGMRGIVTLAAAIALPGGRGGGAFPYRDLIELCAFAVVVGTLVVQGFTLRPLLYYLALKGDDSVQREVSEARCHTLQAALDALDGDQSPEAQAVRLEYEEALRRARASPDGRVPVRLVGDEYRARAVRAARKALGELRDGGQIGDEAYHRVEEDLDLVELSVAAR